MACLASQLCPPQCGLWQVRRWQVRRWQTGDSLAELTALLHRAYAPLAAAGMNFTAASQSQAMTQQRLLGAHTWVAVQGGQIVGSITAAGPFDPNLQAWAHARPWFYRQDLAHFHQYAVDPALQGQGQGLGAELLRSAEAWACGQGHRAMLLDTAMADETWATVEAPPAWRTAAAIGAYRRDAAGPA